MSLEPPVGGSLWRQLILEGSGLPSPLLSPPSCLTAFIPGGLHKWTITNKMFGTAAVITVLFIHLGIFYCSSQPNHEFFSHSFDPIRFITFWILTVVGTFFLQLGQGIQWVSS